MEFEKEVYFIALIVWCLVSIFIACMLIGLMARPAHGETTLYDKSWERQGHISNSGNIYDRDGHRAGRVENGKIYDKDGKRVGSYDNGNIYNKDYQRKGSYKDGRIYDRSGKSKGNYR